MPDLSWVHAELAPFYAQTGRPAIDPELMLRMLILGYVFAIRSERKICAEVQVNLAYRWFCRLSIEDAIPNLPYRASSHYCKRCDLKPRCTAGIARKVSRDIG